VHINGIENFRGYAKRRLKPTTAGSTATSNPSSGKEGLDKTIATTKTR
jgi:hypothetical protein